MYDRLAIVSQKLDYYGLRHRLITEEMLERMTGDTNPGPLRVLAAVVQPPRLYQRQELRTFTDFSPLNRLDDAVPPECDTAREFNNIANRIAAGKATYTRLATRPRLACVAARQRCEAAAFAKALFLDPGFNPCVA